MNDYPAILRQILDQYELPTRGIHGVVHWARVLQNGQRIADVTGADREVIALFALFHDSQRVNDDEDPGHGWRGAEFARALRGELVFLDDTRFELLYEACRLHTDGLTSDDPTLGACWDADRLDLGRVGIAPSPRRLCTDAGRELLGRAHDRAVRHHEPSAVLKEWEFR